MSGLPITGILAGTLGASRIERAVDRDVWIVVGGWADGVEFTSQELRDLKPGDNKAFLDLLNRKRQQLLLKQAKEVNDAPLYQRYPPLWPASGGWALKPNPEPPNKKYLEGVFLAKETDGTWATIKRSMEPLFGGRRAGKVEGSPFQIPLQTERVKVPKPPEPKKVEHEEPPVLRRKYRKA